MSSHEHNKNQTVCVQNGISEKEEYDMEFIEKSDCKMSNTCIAYGDFDGIHLGHQGIINKILEISKKHELTSVLVSFAYDDSLLAGKKILTTEKEKKYLLQKTGLSVMISYRIGQENKYVPLKNFIKDILVDQLGAEVIVAGSENRDINVLRECAKECGFTLEEVSTVSLYSEPVTSERIIKELAEGTLKKANEMLGHPHLIIGEVMHGKALGRTVGLPTANIGFKLYKQLPADGVFGTVSDVCGKMYKGLTNLGHRPTVDNFDYVTVEAFLLDFSKDIYGKTITLEVHALIRGIRKFKDLAEVKIQVNQDIESIRAYFDNLAI
jgi:riboflavin kinase/FMN adenylyltransferase